MDANKLERLKSLDYSLRRTCSNCKAGYFTNSDWGVCEAFKYKHLKHTGPDRKLSVNVSGHCKFHSWSEHQDIHGFVEFVED